MTKNLTQMTNTELKQYLSATRNDDEKFSAALKELMSRRDKDASWFPFEQSPSEVESLIKNKVAQIERQQNPE